MYRLILFVLLFCGLMVVDGCRTMRDITYLADMKNDSLLSDVPGEVPEYRLRPNDNLYVNIQSTNDEVTKLFNVYTTTPGGGSQGFGDPSGQSLYGNLVDK